MKLVDILITHAMNWVNCECAFHILCNGPDGLMKRMAQIEAEINALNLIVEGSDIDYLVSDAKVQLEPKLKALDDAFAAWHSANSIRDEYKRRYEACVSLCVKHCGNGYAMYLVLFNAILLGMNPTHAEPFQALAMPVAAKRIREIPNKAWSSKKWLTPVRPEMPGLRRVTPSHRTSFIPTVLVPDSEILRKLEYDSNSTDLHAILTKATKRRGRRTHRS